MLSSTMFTFKIVTQDKKFIITTVLLYHYYVLITENSINRTVSVKAPLTSLLLNYKTFSSTYKKLANNLQTD